MYNAHKVIQSTYRTFWKVGNCIKALTYYDIVQSSFVFLGQSTVQVIPSLLARPVRMSVSGDVVCHPRLTLGELEEWDR